MSFNVHKWNKQRYLAEANIHESLAQEINKILPESLGYKEFAKAVAEILKNEYGSQNFGPFMDVLHSELGIDESVNEVKDDYYPDSPEALSAFSNQEEGIAINGLVWMGDIPFMKQQVDDLISSGFRCVKLKIGAENFEQERRLLQDLRLKYGEDELEIRVDANGSFLPETAPKILDQLAQLEIHSIEQPIAAGQWDQMAALCECSPVPIALDEELIGLFSSDDKKRCLAHIRPRYLILKPALIGGFRACNAFIESDLDWWITSALESNIGLNAIAQFTATKELHRPQGLGTGGLFVNNFESPLEVFNAQLFYRNHLTWNLNSIA